jgi:hypothetical protein
MKNEPLDFVRVDYAVDNREVEHGRTRRFARVKGQTLPAWAGCRRPSTEST